MGNLGSTNNNIPSSSNASSERGNTETDAREITTSEAEVVVLPSVPNETKAKAKNKRLALAVSAERPSHPPAAMQFEDLVVLLLNIHRSSVSLPLEIVVSLFTEYLDCRPITRKTSQRLLQAGNNANVNYLTLPIPLLRHFRPERVVVTVESHDQGWSSNDRQMHGTRNGSYTWGEIALSSAPEERVEVYRNLHARSQWERQTKTFHAEDAFFAKICEEYETRSHSVLRTSSSPFELLFFVRSAFPGWVNFIQFAEIEIFWSINADVQEVIQEYIARFPARK